MTVIRLVVSVPVLSEQMVVAPPMVSHALKCRTRLLSFNILLTEKASAIVTVYRENAYITFALSLL